ncbi:MAG: histidine kinase [Bacteroidales bacterium]|nr:histidine kinase [Bacteroidales bacterium]
MIKINLKNIIILFLVGTVPVLFFVSQSFFSDIKPNIEFPELLYNLLFSGTVTVVIAVTIISEVNWFKIEIPWEKHPVKRIITQLIVTSFTASVLMAGMLAILYLIIDMPEEYTEPAMIKETFVSNIFVANVMNLIISSILEGLYFFQKWKESLVETEKLQKENILSQFDMLKHQVNPHFLFNSLNVLSSLVHKDADKAEEFIDEFSKVYRYILELNRNTTVKLKEEVDILRSYILLQKFRFNMGLEVSISLPAQLLNTSIPPLSLQMIVENAVKHNIISDDKPLQITIEANEKCIVIKNNLQLRNENVNSTGVGLRNITERYKLIANETPNFYIESDFYYAELPILEL